MSTILILHCAPFQKPESASDLLVTHSLDSVFAKTIHNREITPLAVLVVYK